MDAYTHLSQHPIFALVASASAMLTLFFSPPLTPLMAAFPTFVSRTCLSPNTVAIISVTFETYVSLVSPLNLALCWGARVFAANARVC